MDQDTKELLQNLQKAMLVIGEVLQIGNHLQTMLEERISRLEAERLGKIN